MRASWNELDQALTLANLSIKPASKPYARQLALGDGISDAELTLSLDMRWYRICVPLLDVDIECIKQLHSAPLFLARIALVGQSYVVLADIPASDVEGLTVSLNRVLSDISRIRDIVTQASDLTKPLVTELTPLRSTSPVNNLDSFLDELQDNWVIEGESNRYKLGRQPGASRKLPPICRLQVDDVLTITTTISTKSDHPLSYLAHLTFLSKLNAGQHVSARLTDNNVLLRVAVLAGVCQLAQLRSIYVALIGAYQSCGFELQALETEQVALLFLGLQKVNRISTYIKEYYQ
jgi:hypothetical protein